MGIIASRGARCGAAFTHTPNAVSERIEKEPSSSLVGELGGGGVRHVPRGDAELECFDYFVSLNRPSVIKM